MKIIDGRKIKEEFLNNLKKEIESLPFVPMFCDILVGEDNVSASYVRIKGKAAESVGIKFRTINFPLSITTEEIVEEIENLNKVPLMCGIIVQLPLPAHIDTQTVLDAISPSLDVDCLGSYNNEKFYNDIGSIGYPTALACLHIIDSLNLDLKDKNIVVIGRGRLVGLPVTHILESRGLSVKVVHSQSYDAKSIIANADIIISAVGKGKFIDSNMVKNDVLIIDAGTSEDNGSIVGDINMDSFIETEATITPTPGGVGPVTVATLLNNILIVANNKK